MNFTFEPKTDEELAKGNLLAEGEYDFQIIEVIARSSHAGNPMLEISINLTSETGDQVFVKDFLVSMPKMVWKIKRFCECIGLKEEYKKGKIEPDALKGLKGRAQVCIEKKDNFPPRNKIKDYIVGEKEDRYFQIDKDVNKKAGPVNVDEDIPF